MEIRDGVIGTEGSCAAVVDGSPHIKGIKGRGVFVIQKAVGLIGWARDPRTTEATAMQMGW